MVSETVVENVGIRLRRGYGRGRYRAAVRAYVGLGANLGDREVTLRRAVEHLGEADGIEVVAVSAFRETAPWGPVEQPPFLNGAVALETDLDPRTLLAVLLDVERRLGRERREGERWGPRVIDLDVLLHGDLVVDEPGLVVPHPRLHERRFALEPLAELDPDAVVPGRARVSELLRRLDDEQPPEEADAVH
jgi:2-amino-4-hydroxy-6-hydroxymethyldihydropteridine diphosphokinase